jgi:hypothetical protein
MRDVPFHVQNKCCVVTMYTCNRACAKQHKRHCRMRFMVLTHCLDNSALRGMRDLPFLQIVRVACCVLRVDPNCCSHSTRVCRHGARAQNASQCWLIYVMLFEFDMGNPGIASKTRTRADDWEKMRSTMRSSRSMRTSQSSRSMRTSRMLSRRTQG